MSRKLFVGGLAWATTNESLGHLFEGYGEVEEARVIMDRDSGQSKGFGFVTMASAEQAHEAMVALNDTKLDGRNIRVNEANERKDGGRRDFAPQHARKADAPVRSQRSEPIEPEVIRRGPRDPGGQRVPKRPPNHRNYND